MPKFRWTNLPPSLREHLFDRVADRQISAEDLYKLKLWREAEPEAPEGPWYKDFGSFKRSEEHTSELQSHSELVCRLLLEKKIVAQLLADLRADVRLPPGQASKEGTADFGLHGHWAAVATPDTIYFTLDVDQTPAGVINDG